MWNINKTSITAEAKVYFFSTTEKHEKTKTDYLNMADYKTAKNLRAMLMVTSENRGEFQIEFRSNRIFKEKKMGSDKRAANCLKAFAGVADEAMVRIKHKFQLSSPNRLKAWTDKPEEL